MADINNASQQPPLTPEPRINPSVKARMIVPDVARGLALLGIAIANVPTAWMTAGSDDIQFLGAINSGLDQVLAVLTTMFAHNRGLPLFSTLLGFGVGLIATSLWRKHFPATRARNIILRRYFFLAIFGAIHLLLIFYGDIMFYYGLSAMIIALLLTVRDKILSIISYIVLALMSAMALALLFSSLSMGIDFTDFSAAVADGSGTSSYGELLAFNAQTFLINAASYPVYLFGYLPIMLIGFTWARRGVLADVPSHRKELIIWAVIGAVYIVGIGMTWGLAEIGVLPTTMAATFSLSNLFMGAITGPALLAMFALALQPVQAAANRGEKAPIWLQIPMALGKRSMSGYLFQSFAFFVICFPFVLGITPESVSGQVGLAFAVWAVSIVVAWVMEKSNIQGPFEKIHRRLSYGPTMQPELHTSKQRRQLQSQAQAQRPETH